jgi:hypothetical protein
VDANQFWLASPLASAIRRGMASSSDVR